MEPTTYKGKSCTEMTHNWRSQDLAVPSEPGGRGTTPAEAAQWGRAEICLPPPERGPPACRTQSLEDGPPAHSPSLAKADVWGNRDNGRRQGDGARTGCPAASPEAPPQQVWLTWGRALGIILQLPSLQGLGSLPTAGRRWAP